MTGLIFAAGLGTRLKPWTDHHPKALVEVGGKPMLQRVIENMIKAGITDIVVNVHHMHNQIIDFLEATDLNADITISDETTQLLDTGGAILKATELIGTDTKLLIHNADIFSDIDLLEIIKTHDKLHNDVTLLTSTRPSSRQLLFDNNMRLTGWINNSTLDTLPPGLSSYNLKPLSFNGIHIINPSVITWLKRHTSTKVFPIIPQYVAMSQDIAIRAYTPPHHYTWIDIGKPETLEKAIKIARYY